MQHDKELQFIFTPEAEPSAEELIQIADESYPNGSPWSKQAFANDLMDPYAGYGLAIQNGKTIGFIGYRKIYDEAEVTNIAVLNTMKNQGIATRLISAWFEKLKADGVTQIFLEVRQGNQAAIHLYERMGFKSIDKRYSYYTEPVEDAVIMQYTFKNI